jgi:hypothetical protein
MCGCGKSSVGNRLSRNKSTLGSCGNRKHTLIKSKNKLAALLNVTANEDLKNSYKQILSDIDNTLKESATLGQCVDLKFVSAVKNEIENEYSKYRNPR